MNVNYETTRYFLLLFGSELFRVFFVAYTQPGLPYGKSNFSRKEKWIGS